MSAPEERPQNRLDELNRRVATSAEDRDRFESESLARAKKYADLFQGELGSWVLDDMRFQFGMAASVFQSDADGKFCAFRAAKKDGTHDVIKFIDSQIASL